MTRYISIQFRLSNAEFPAALPALLSHPHFHPVSLGGIEGHAAGDDWFLSGYAMEDFVRRFVPSAPSKPASVELASAKSEVNAGYLALIAEGLKYGQSPQSISPYEQIDEAADRTFIVDYGIGEAEAEACRRWYAAHPDGIVYLYGTVNLVAPPQSASETPWRCAFRDGAEPVGQPLVLIRLARAPLFRSQLEMTLMTWSTVWLEDEGNLDRLVSLVEAFAGSQEGHIASSSLNVEGSSFMAHEGRLRAAFSSVVESDCNSKGGQ
jgi:hypothetical protein